MDVEGIAGSSSVNCSFFFFFFSSRRRHTRFDCDWSSDVCSSDLLQIEHDETGNRAKAYLYCLETRCPETGWTVPLSGSWVVSRNKRTVAQLFPNQDRKSVV